jgi:hypothetical protein
MILYLMVNIMVCLFKLSTPYGMDRNLFVLKVVHACWCFALIIIPKLDANYGVGSQRYPDCSTQP